MLSHLPAAVRAVLAGSFALFAVPHVRAQDPPAAQEPAGPVPQVLLDGLDWRLIGPFRGGRSSACCGVPQDRSTYWFGSAGGGVWKTTDGGGSWKNMSDGSFGGSVGAVAVAPSDPNIVYVGGGESTWRGNVSSGDGLWKSTDAGATWTFVGLADSRHISRIRIDPKDPQRVFAAVMGHVSGPSQERGVYRSTDGGATWARVLFANELAGCVDLCFEPGNAQVLYASTWRAIRRPHAFASGGDGSGLWQSTDGGTTWKDLSTNQGMPKGPLGIIGVSVSAAAPKRVYAQVEAQAGGMFRSDDRGATWTCVNRDRELRQRAWYYTRCEADPKDQDTVYVLNVSLHRSTDGGKTFARVGTPHSDNHDLWLDPADPQRLIEANDGGANVSTDGGASWSSQQNQPTAQFYRVTTDTASPYRIYGAQQDNSTVRIRHRSRDAGIGRGDWEATAGGESGWLAPKPDDAEIVFGGSYGGYLERRDHRLGMSRRVDVWPDNPMGAGAEAMRYRFQWNFPILFSPHDPRVLYTAGNVLFRSIDEGQTWQPISGDLTRNDPSKLGSSGGPITQDNTGVEYYCTIFTVAESPRSKGVIWCGSDDGLVHVTQDGGKNWQDVTPPELPEWAQINCIEADPHGDGGCYVAATRYKLDDFAPYLYVTKDYGQTWRLATRGIDPGWFTRCVRADPQRPGLLFAGTERTVWMSNDDGLRWQRLQRNLPLTPIADLCIRDDALIAATQGRAFWSFDHLAQLRQLEPDQAQRDVVLFVPEPFVLLPGKDDEVARAGRNPASAPIVRFFLGGDATAPVDTACKLEVLGFDGKVLWTRDTAVAAEAADGVGQADEAAGLAAGTDAAALDDDAAAAAKRGKDAKDDVGKLECKRGINAIRWEWRTVDAKGFDGMVLWAGGLNGPSQPAPGTYRARLTFGAVVQEQPLVVLPDPRAPATVAELQARFAFVVDCGDAITTAPVAVLAIRSLRRQMRAATARADGDAKTQLEQQAKAVADQLTAVEEALYQTKSKSGQDPLNYPIRLTDKLAGVMGEVNGALFGPTAAQVGVKDTLLSAIAAELAKLAAIRLGGVAAFNALARQLEIPHVQ